MLHVNGVERLRGGSHAIGPEHVEVGSLIGMAAVTGSDITIDGIVPDDLWPILPVFHRLGIELEVGTDSVRVPPASSSRSSTTCTARSPRSRTGPGPRFRRPHLDRRRRRDAGEGHGAIFEKMFESRLFFVDKLVSMGARIILCDPHRVVITGPAPLFGQRMSSPDIRAGHGDADRRALRRGHLDDR